MPEFACFLICMYCTSALQSYANVVNCHTLYNVFCDGNLPLVDEMASDLAMEPLHDGLVDFRLPNTIHLQKLPLVRI